VGFVRAGLGYAVLSQLGMAGASLDGVTVLALTGPKVERKIGIIARASSELSPVAAEFLRILKGHLNSWQATNSLTK
jgi:DNA-binding transcriptional LysR family regulator